MRIIAGTKRAKSLFTPKDNTIRPTSDRARESVYNILASKLSTFNDLDVLDVFSGTGALGLEAASRGARSVTFVDIDLSLTKKNALLCGFNNLYYLKADATKLPKAARSFDLIFLDAPYNRGLTEPTLNVLLNNGYFKTAAIIVIETAKEEKFTSPSALLLVDERIYGAAKFSFLTLK